MKGKLLYTVLMLAVFLFMGITPAISQDEVGVGSKPGQLL